MTDRSLPHSDSEQRSKEVLDASGYDVGIVTSAPKIIDGQHHVAVQSATLTGDTFIPVIPSVHGDYYVPPQGSPVTVAQFNNEEWAVVGSPVPNVETPSIEAGERILSHPRSKAAVKFNADGTIDIYGDSTVRINGGEMGVITDVSVDTTTDGDGHVTDVSLDLIRNTDILVSE